MDEIEALNSLFNNFFIYTGEMIRNTLEEDKALKLLQKEFGSITASYVGENKMKKPKATNKPTKPIPSKSEGKTVKTKFDPEIKLPSSAKITTPCACATYIDGIINKPARKAIETSIKVTCAPSVTIFSFLAI